MTKRSSTSHNGPLDRLSFNEVWQIASALACVLYHFHPNTRNPYVADEIWPHVKNQSRYYNNFSLETLRLAMACRHFHPIFVSKAPFNIITDRNRRGIYLRLSQLFSKSLSGDSIEQELWFEGCAHDRPRLQRPRQTKSELCSNSMPHISMPRHSGSLM